MTRATHIYKLLNQNDQRIWLYDAVFTNSFSASLPPTVTELRKLTRTEDWWTADHAWTKRSKRTSSERNRISPLAWGSGLQVIMLLITHRHQYIIRSHGYSFCVPCICFFLLSKWRHHWLESCLLFYWEKTLIFIVSQYKQSDWISLSISAIHCATVRWPKDCVCISDWFGYYPNEKLN